MIKPTSSQMIFESRRATHLDSTYYVDINDVDDPTAPRVKEAAIEESKALITKVKDLELKNSVLQLNYQSHVHGYCATIANFDAILKNVGAPDDKRKNILDSLSGLRWNRELQRLTSQL